MSNLFSLFFIFFKIGLFTVGGGMAMIPLIQQELVDRGMMSAATSVDMVAISQMTPGPFGVNCATFVGMDVSGVAGAAIATLGIVLPSFVICLILSRFFFRFTSNPIVQSVFSGIKPIILSLIFSGLVSIGKTSLFPAGTFSSIDIPVLCIAAIMILLLQKTKLSPTLLVLACGVFGAIFLQG